MRAVLLVVAVAVAAAALLPARAEIVDEASLQLAPAERARLQTILDEPIPPGALNLTRNEIYRRKDLAAFRLGDNVARERVLREWAAIEDTGVGLPPERAESEVIDLTATSGRGLHMIRQLMTDVDVLPGPHHRGTRLVMRRSL